VKSVVQEGVGETKRSNVGNCVSVAAGGGLGAMKHKKKDNNRRENKEEEQMSAAWTGFAATEMR
jgi:hypothetical protein